MVIHKQALTLEKLSLIVFGILFIFLFLAACFLTNTKVKATGNDITDEVNITVPVSCTLSGGDHSYNVTLNPGQENSNIGPSNIKAVCNDYNGYSIYAIGYSGNSYTGNNTKLLGTIANNNISTNTSGNDSYWAMKVNAVSGTYTPTITNDFDNSNFHIIPANYTQIAKLTSTTDAGSNPTGSNISTYYKVKISTTQTADTYTGKVKYTLVHPNTARNPGEKSLDTATTLQQVTYCSDTLTIGQVYALSDSRDNQSYKVAKLADGNCWMLENLALDPTDSTTAANMNASNTNASAEAVYNYLNGGDASYPWSSDAVVNVTSGFNYLLSPKINNAYKDTLVTSYGLAATNGQAKVGIYYNYCAATVGTYCAGVDNYGGDDATMDVCPIHWRMPDSDEFEDLTQEYGAMATESTSLQYNLSTPLSGTFNGSLPNGQNSYGYWWTRTWSDERSAAAMYLDATYVGYGTVSRETGGTIRCLVDS